MEELVHDPLKCRRRRSESEWHLSEFVEPKLGIKCRLSEVVRVHPYLPIPGAQIQSSIVPCIIQCRNCIIHSRAQIRVFLSNQIQLARTNAKSHCTVLL